MRLSLPITLLFATSLVGLGACGGAVRAESDDAIGSDGGGNGQDGGYADSSSGNTPGFPGSDAGVSPFDAAIIPVATASVLAAGDHFACATSDHTNLRCWGDGQPITQIGGQTGWTDIDVGDGNPSVVCGVVGNGRLLCFSSDNFSPEEPGLPDANIRQVAVGQGDACAISLKGPYSTLYCWGQNNSAGQLGLGDTATHDNPTQVGTDTDWRFVALTGDHACAIKNDGSLYCWGQLGAGIAASSPTRMNAGSSWSDIDVASSPSQSVSCGVRSDGALMCWGDAVLLGVHGQTATAIGDEHDWATVRVAPDHACAVKVDGTLHCWGSNQLGQLGIDMSTLATTTPQRVGTDTDWTEAVVGFGSDSATAGKALGWSCGRKVDGTVYCWGTNQQNELGQSTAAAAYSESPLLVK